MILLLAELAAVLGFFSWGANYPSLVMVLRTMGLPLLLIVVAVLAVSIGQMLFHFLASRRESGSWGGLLRQHRLFLLIWLAATLLAVGLFTPGSRIQFDETSILLTSKAIHEERETITPAASLAYGHNLKLQKPTIDKRPYLYALFVSFLHDLRGYSPRNAFYANMLLASGTLALVGLWARRLVRDESLASLAMFALVSVPLFCEYATGGSIDITNLFCMALLGLTTTAFLDQPSARSGRIMIGSAILLAYARYESLVFATLALGALVLVHRRQRQFHLDWTVPAMALSLFPLACIHFTTLLSPAENFQFADKGVQQAFSFSYVQRNLEHAARFFLNTEHQLANSVVVLVLGGAAWLLVAVSWRRRRRAERDSNGAFVFWAFSALVLAGFGLLMCYSWGELDQPVGSRLALPLYLLFALSLPLALRDFRSRGRLPQIVAGLLVFGIYWQSIPVAAKGLNTTNYAAVMELRAFDEFLESQPDRRIVILNSYTNFWTTRDVFAIAPSAINSNPAFLANLLRSGLYREVVLIEEYKLEGKGGSSNPVLNELDAHAYPLSTEFLFERNICNLRRIRFYRISPSTIGLIDALGSTEADERAQERNQK